MTTGTQGSVRKIATAVAVVGFVIGGIAILQARTVNDVDIPTESTQSDESEELVSSDKPELEQVSAPINGLQGEYFSGPPFAGDSVTQVDSEIDFDWGSEPPAQGIEPGRFSARWRGSLTPQENGEHEFFLRASGKVSLWVDGVRPIRQWAEEETDVAEFSGSVSLEVGEPVNIVVEFLGTTDEASLELEWQTSEDERQTIPSDQLTSWQPDSGVTYFASPDGVEGNSGLSLADTIPLQKAADLVAPGDTVEIADGTYTRPEDDPTREAVLIVDQSGTQDHPITFVAADGAKPILETDSSRALEVRGASYLVFDGLSAIGPTDDVTQEQADSQTEPDEEGNVTADRQSSSSGFYISPLFDAPEVAAHHVTVRNAEVKKFGGCGICVNDSDYVIIEYNSVTESSLYSSTNSAGIIVQGGYNTDDESSPKILVRGNRVFGNESRVVNVFSNSDPSRWTITGGGGIGVQGTRNRFSNDAADAEPYLGRIVVENNVVFDNGGFGFTVNNSDRVTVTNNTFHNNSLSDSSFFESEIYYYQAEDVTFQNNIVSTATGKDVLSSAKVGLTKFVTNLVFGSTGWGSDLDPGSQVESDPLFVDADNGDLKLQEGSPAIDAGTAEEAPSVDIDLLGRPQGDGPDLGAYESG